MVSDIPFEELPGAARQSQAQGIVLSASIAPPTTQFRDALAQLTSAVDVPVFVGGPTSVLLGEVVQQAGAIALGANIEFSLRRITARLNDGSRPSAADNNKNRIQQTSQENTCRSQV